MQEEQRQREEAEAQRQEEEKRRFLEVDEQSVKGDGFIEEFWSKTDLKHDEKKHVSFQRNDNCFHHVF